jgi:hypothetical protein
VILIIFLAVPENQPVIMGVPPPANSHFTHGRRKFLGKTKDEDRAGVPRLGLPEAGSSNKRKGVSSKFKAPPPKKTSKRKAKGSTSSSDEEAFQQENNDDDDEMFISDDPIPTKTDVKSSRMDALDIPFFSNSPRTTRSAREKQRLQQLSNRKERKEEKLKKASKKGEVLIHLPFSHLLNANINSYLGSIRG